MGKASDSMHLALIEDEEFYLRPLLEGLQRLGCTYSTYGTVRAAIERSQEIACADVILLDVIIPVGDVALESQVCGNREGIYALSELRDLGVSIPAILVSSETRFEDVRDSIDGLGIVDFLQKSRLSLQRLYQSIVRAAKSGDESGGGREAEPRD